MRKHQHGFDFRAARWSKRHRNTIRNTTLSNTPWLSKTGDALQTGDAPVQKHTQSLVVKHFGDVLLAQ